MRRRLARSGFSRSPAILLLGTLLALALAGHAGAQRLLGQPNLLALFPPGAPAGETTEVVITAQSELEGADRLLFSHPGIKAKQKMRAPDKFYPEPRPVENTFELQIAADVPPAVYEVRAAGPFGVSNARRFRVESVPTAREGEQNTTAENASDLPVGTAVYGQCEPGQYDYFRLQADGGKSLVIECMAERLDAGGDLSLAVLGEDGEELTRSLDAIGRDPLIYFTPPADGEYLVRVNELTYGTDPNAANAPYRLFVSRAPRVEFIDPPFAERGKTSQFTLYGWNLGSGAAPVTVDGAPMEKLSVSIAAPSEPQMSGDMLLRPASWSLDTFTFRHKTSAGASNPVRLALADRPLTREADGNDEPESAEEIEIPCELVGLFDRPGDLDWYAFQAKKDQRLWIEVDSQRLGLMTDPLLVVQQVIEKDDGEITVRELATEDDKPAPETRMLARLTSGDPSWMLTAPEDGRYRVLVRDQFGSSQGGPQQFYRLRIAPPQPDFRLLAFPGIAHPENHRQVPRPTSCVVRPGGAEEILVVALRREGFDGAIEVSIPDVPDGFQVQPVILGPEQPYVPLVVRANSDAKRNTAPVDVVGKATIERREVTRRARCAEILWNINNQPVSPLRLTEQIVLSVDETTPLPGRLEPPEQKVWRMARGGKLELPFRLVKQEGELKGNVELSAVGLPPDNSVRAGRVNVTASKPDGKLTLDVNTNAPLGRFSLFARGKFNMDYQRGVALHEQAKTDKERLDKLVKEFRDTYREAQQERQKADRAAQTAQQDRNNAENARGTAQQQAKQAAEQAAQYAQKVDEAQKKADEAAKQAADLTAKVEQAGDDAAREAAESAANQAQQQAEQLASAAEAAAKQAKEFQARSKEAAEGLAKAETALKEAEQKLTAAEKAKQQAQETEAAAKQDADTAQRLQREAQDRERRYNGIARKQQIEAYLHSPPVTVEIVPFPATVELEPEELTLRAGESAEFTATAKREFGFEDDIDFQLQSPSGVGGLGLKNDKIEKNKSEGKLTLTTSKNSQPGTHTAELRIRMRFNNRNLEDRRPLKLTILPPKEEK